jgi:hypothetical protein
MRAVRLPSSDASTMCLMIVYSPRFSIARRSADCNFVPARKVLSARVEVLEAIILGCR